MNEVEQRSRRCSIEVTKMQRSFDTERPSGTGRQQTQKIKTRQPQIVCKQTSICLPVRAKKIAMRVLPPLLRIHRTLQRPAQKRQSTTSISLYHGSFLRIEKAESFKYDDRRSTFLGSLKIDSQKGFSSFHFFLPLPCPLIPPPNV